MVFAFLSGCGEKIKRGTFYNVKILILVTVSIVLLEHSRAHLFMYCLAAFA